MKMTRNFEENVHAANFYGYVTRLIVRKNPLHITASKYLEDCEELGIKPSIEDFKIACKLSGVDFTANVLGSKT